MGLLAGDMQQEMDSSSSLMAGKGNILCLIEDLIEYDAIIFRFCTPKSTKKFKSVMIRKSSRKYLKLNEILAYISFDSDGKSS